MMFLGNSAEVNREQHADRLRRVEREHLADVVAAAQDKPAVWQNIKGRLSDMMEKRQVNKNEGSEGSYVLGQS